MVKRYYPGLSSILVPVITYTGVVACAAGQQGSQFTANAPVGTVIGFTLSLAGFFNWGSTVGSRNVRISANISTPVGAPFGNNVAITYLYNNLVSGTQGFSGTSSVKFFVTIPAGGTVVINTNANIENAGSGYSTTAYIVASSVNGQTTAYSQILCVGVSTAG
jgi:hypothetical protein